MQRRFSLQNHIQIAEVSGLSLCVLDSSLRCVFGNGTINAGDSLRDMLHKKVELPVRSCCVSRITVGDSFYCVRIFSALDECEPQYYLCEVLDSTAAQEISENTDLIIRQSAVLEALRYRADKAQELADVLCDSPAGKLTGVAAELRSRLDRIGAVIDAVAVHQDMISSPSEKVLFDVGKLCERLCERCNAALSDVGRCIELPLCDEELFICADGRNTVIVLMNMIRNALACSSVDCVPQLVVYRAILSEQIVIKTINAPTGMTDADGSDAMWLALVKRYAWLAGGSAELINGERSILLLSLPAASPSEIAVYRLEEGLDSRYDTEIRRCLEAILAQYEMTANVQ